MTTSKAIGVGLRMLVFVPDDLENVAEFARQVYSEARQTGRQVVYLALPAPTTDELAAARQLATLTALTQDEPVFASAVQCCTRDREKALTMHARPGDLVIWPDAGLLAPGALAARLGITQRSARYGRAASSTAPAAGARGPAWGRAALFWLIGAVILFGFSYLEFRAETLLAGGGLKLVLIFLFGAELALLYRWSRMFS